MKNKKAILILVIIFGVGSVFGLVMSNKITNNVVADDLQLDEQEATIRAIQKVKPAVVSIIVYDEEQYTSINLSTGMQMISKERVEMGSGTGFLISADGLIITNKHVVSVAEKETAEYRIILNSGKKYYAQLIGKDPLNDLAILKIFDKDLPYVEIGDSNNLQIGSSVIAIGNALGIYQNSATKGIVSGLSRNLSAGDQYSNYEKLNNVIQTDAEINLGNSGGPLIDLNGEVIGINVAVDNLGTAIGFAIPINDARVVINSVIEIGRIVRPRLGIRYIMIDEEIARDNNLSRNMGAWVIPGDEYTSSIISDSPAQKAGLQEGDIIFEINSIKIEGKNTLRSVSQDYKPGDKIGLKIQRGDEILIKVVELDEFK